MSTSWDDCVASFWTTADDTDPDRALTEMARMVDEMPPGDPDGLFEWASVHDFLGREADAIPLYRAALEAGLAGERKPQAVIQLASSLRNIGQPRAAVELLKDCPEYEAVGLTRHAFLSLALHDCGEHAEALHLALAALAPTLPLYRHAVSHYATELTAEK